MSWTQVYDPLHNWILSTGVAALPILVLFGLLAGLRVKPHWCAIAAAGTAVVVAVTIFGMPVSLAGMSFLYGVGFGVLKIAWIVLSAVYLYDISVFTGQFEIMKESVAGITADRRLQLLLVAFCFGAFIEGAAGFGAPVAIAGAFMIGLGFKPFHAAALNLLANTSPVAWGAIGTPVHTLAAVSGLPESDLSAMIGRILPITGIIVPFWQARHRRQRVHRCPDGAPRHRRRVGEQIECRRMERLEPETDHEGARDRHRRSEPRRTLDEGTEAKRHHQELQAPVAVMPATDSFMISNWPV